MGALAFARYAPYLNAPKPLFHLENKTESDSPQDVRGATFLTFLDSSGRYDDGTGVMLASPLIAGRKAILDVEVALFSKNYLTLTSFGASCHDNNAADSLGKYIFSTFTVITLRLWTTILIRNRL